MGRRVTEICIPPPLQHDSFNLWYDINNLCISLDKEYMKGRVVMKKLLFSLLLILCMSSPVFAANWYWLGYTRSGSQFYVDNDSVQKNEKYAIVWTKIVHADSSWDTERLFLRRNEKGLAILDDIIYDAHGTVKGVHKFKIARGNWFPIAPGTMTESLYKSIWPY